VKTRRRRLHFDGWFRLSIPDQLQGALMVILARRPEMRHRIPAEAARASERVAKYQGVAV
jgi:hypothetical protein